MELYKELNKKYGTHFMSDYSINLPIVFETLDLSEDMIDDIFQYYLKNNHLSGICGHMFHIASSCKHLTEKLIDKYKQYLSWNKISYYINLSEKFIEEHTDFIDWNYISIQQKLSENFIRKFSDKLNWYSISMNQDLSEEFILENADKVHWRNICQYQKLSEKFMEENRDLIYWDIVSTNQVLSEEFIKRNPFLMKDYFIFQFQKLSEDFIVNCEFSKNFKTRITMYQKLSNDFILNHNDLIDMENVAIYQKLPEEFIEENKYSLILKNVFQYQKLSKKFIKKYSDMLDLSLIKDNWIYKSAKEKKCLMLETDKYECYDDYFIAYKAVRADRYSLYNFQYKYEKGGVYESWCDCSSNESSFGLSVGTKEFANDYGASELKHIIVRCKIRYEDVGRIVHDGNKIRCFKIEILD